MDLKIFELMMLCDRYGMDTTLGEVLKREQDGRIYRCPKCGGEGLITIEYNGYPSGLPDSGWVYEPAFRKENCDLCQGQGYTKIPYQPKMVQDGWEPMK